ncbi:phosphatase PAP2 family protein [Pilimelia terevasa]|nr:phosphatase PAP2 family protein [Pilimelia terevasa]
MAEETRAGDRPRGGWAVDGALVAVLCGGTALLATGHLVPVDLAVRGWVSAHQVDPAWWAARILNFLGQGGPLTVLALALAGWLAWRRGSVRPVLPVAFVYLALVLTVGPVKVWTRRPFPREDQVADPAAFFSDAQHRLAYPSGHTANAVAWIGVLVLLGLALRRAYGAAAPPAGAVRALRVGAPLVVLVTTVYLGHHWLSDSVAGVLIGVLVDRQRRRIPWDALPLPGVPARWRGPGLAEAARAPAPAPTPLGGRA